MKELLRDEREKKDADVKTLQDEINELNDLLVQNKSASILGIVFD